MSGQRQYPDAERFVYWFDSYTVTTSINISDNPFEIDVSHLYPGLHTLHACGHDKGCDSVYELTLSVNQTYLVNDTAALPSAGSGYQ